MSTRIVPVIVVGAGPAGATAARRLALAGHEVQVLDRAAFPRNKPCGGGISLRVLQRFPYLECELPAIATHRIGRLHLEGPDGESALVASDGPAALMVRRLEFDNLLVSLAVRAGAQLTTGVEIVQARQEPDYIELVARNGRRFRAAAVIAADGVHSVVARRLGLNTGWPATAVALDMMEETPRARLREVDPSTCWVAYGYQPAVNGSTGTRSRAAAEGYAYVFPKRSHVNVGIGYVLAHYRECIDEAPYELQQRFVDALRARGITEGESVRSNFTPFLIPIGGPLRHPGQGRVLLAGDAGGFVNGFTGEGIYYAMVSGERAADAVRAHGPDAAALATEYRRACEREIGAELRDSVLIQRYLFADRRRIAAVIAGARRNPALTRLVLQFIVGLMSYHSLRRRMLARSPLLLARLLWALVAGVA